MGASLVGGGAGVTVNVDRTVAAGTHIENEPIIKSDGAGSVMQWDNSNADAGEGIYFVEGGSAGDPLRLGINIAAPTVPLDVAGAAKFAGVSHTISISMHPQNYTKYLK